MGTVNAHFGKHPERMLLFFAVFIIVPAACARNQTGFISIDCGSNPSSYQDPDTRLIWRNDDDYIRTGLNGAVFNHVDSDLPNFKALQNFRYFPIQRNKHCFVLNMSTNSALVLIRAMFLHGGASELVQPIEFNVSVNAAIWFPVQYISTLDDDLMTPKIHEGIFLSPSLGNNIYVCLLPTRGTPFISSLELRPLDHSGVMYNFSGRDNVYLSNLVRWNAGAPIDAPIVRYPDDEFDRLWMNNECGVSGANSSNPSLLLHSTSAKVNNVPSKVIADGWNGNYTSNGLLQCYKTFPPSYGSRYVYVLLYFATLGRLLGLNTEIFINDKLMGEPFNVSGITVLAFEHEGLPTDEVDLVLESDSDSGYPILNALELYEENTFNPTTTTSNSESVVNFLKEIYNMEDWQGDPCSPLPYEWLGCAMRDPYSPYSLEINTVTLSNLSDSDNLLTLNGDDFWSLSVLSLTYSGINDLVANSLMNNLSYYSLGNLNFSHNHITDLQWFYQLSNGSGVHDFYSLDVSYNSLSGEVPSFVNVSTAQMSSLYLSHNKLSSLPAVGWGNQSTDNYILDSLAILDLSHNNISSDIGLFNELVLRNNLTLRELYISDNSITGEFPGEVYFDTLKHLRILNLDRNKVNGVLDLTSWHKNLQLVINGFANSSFVPVNQIFSFLNNSITGVNPSAEQLHSTIEIFLAQQENSGTKNSNDSDVPRFNMGGVLLGGNPYCENAKSHSQRYLCRISVNDTIHDKRKHKKHKTLVILTSVSGAFLLTCAIIFTVTVWKLWRKVRVLQSVQQALADQKVKPPFYTYHDIKLATRNFHKDNILGKGGFGIVYKGILADDTAIAAKKLFQSNKEQVLNDFLNEVVLITGIKHKNLAQLKGCCIKERNRILVYEYAEQGNLADILWGGARSERTLDWTQRFSICVNIARGLAYLHEELQPRIIHRDIKAANILLDRNFNPKIADFGLARSILEEETKAHFTQFVGTMGYIAPEYANEGQLTVKADVYSFGILVLEIVSGRRCFNANLPPDEIYIKNWVEKLQEDQNLLEILDVRLRRNCPAIEVLKVIHIALICVQLNRKCRPTMSQVVTMFLGNIDLTHFLDINHQHQRAIDEMYAVKDHSNSYDHNNEISESTEMALLSASNSLITNPR